MGVAEAGYDPAMIIESSEHPEWLSNTWLVVDREGGTAVMIDSGGPVEPLLERIAELDASLDAILLTHHHWDHVAELEQVLAAHPGTPVLAHPIEREAMSAMGKESTGDMQPGEKLTFGDLEFEALLTPGHTAGMLALVAGGTDVFTGDTLFKGSVGGVRAPGHTTFEDLRSSVMDVLLQLPRETVIRPGHRESSTVGEELDTNSFVRIWRGLDPEGEGRCVVNGEEEVDLILLGPDYDGGHKAWIRLPDGSDDLVPGSIVEPA
jgi:glyoxylase-like metal-dependent hydrolase (beta-lactamase superfamily II)